MATKARLGSGVRFRALEAELAKRRDVHDPAALAAEIGRKKLGAKRMAKLAARGRKRAAEGSPAEERGESTAVERSEGGK